MLTAPPSPAVSSSRLGVLSIAGSIRTDSHNRSLLRAAVELAPGSMSIAVYEGLASIPPYNEDDDVPARLHSSVSALRRMTAVADGLLVATPEYNQSVPGVLKNALDWLSRPNPGSALDGLPVAIVGATTGPWGTRLAQAELRRVLLATGALPMQGPALYVKDARGKFDDDRLVHEPTRERLSQLLGRFVAWIDAVGIVREGADREPAVHGGHAVWARHP